MLKPIVVPSIYRNSAGRRVVLPKRMALLDSDAANSIHMLYTHMETINARLYLSDAYRTREAQSKAWDDYTSGRKKAFSPPPGGSIHEAGRAIDIDVDSLGISLLHFWKIAALYGWHPIISEPLPSRSESWHFEYLAYWRVAPANIQFKRCAVLEAYLENDVHELTACEMCFLLQGYLRLMDLYTLRIDGIPGPGTRGAIEKYNNLYAENLTIVGPDVVALAQRVRVRWHHHTLRK